MKGDPIRVGAQQLEHPDSRVNRLRLLGAKWWPLRGIVKGAAALADSGSAAAAKQEGGEVKLLVAIGDSG